MRKSKHPVEPEKAAGAAESRKTKPTEIRRLGPGWADVVKRQKHGEFETTDSDKTKDESETAHLDE